MRKTYIVLLTGLLSLTSPLRAQVYSIANAAWTSTSAWSTIGCGGASCGCTPGDPVIICSGTTITFTGAFSVGPGATISTLTINTGGKLIVNGDVDFKKNSTVTINSGGALVINGNFTNNNNSTGITDNGGMSISGTGTFGNGSTVTGSGAVVVSGSTSGAGTVFGTNTGCTNCSLPISLLFFTASYNNDAVALSWATGTEINNSYFTIDRSVDGVSYTTIDSVKGAGNSTAVLNYSAIDYTAGAGINYYRLKQTDYDGNSTYPGMAIVSVDKPAIGITLIPNPAKNFCAISFASNSIENFSLSVYDCTGRQVITKNVETVKGYNTIQLDISSLSVGLYFITLPVNTSVLKAKLLKN